MIKNVANQTVDFLLLSTTDGSAVTTGTPAVYYKGDGGTQTVGTGTISHKGLGEWEYIPVQAETNFNHIVFLATLTGALSQAVNIYTKTGDAYTAVIALNNISSADVNLACDTALSDYGANTTTPPTVQEIRAEIDNHSTQLSLLVSRLTALRAGYLDKLNVSGTLAHSDAASTYKADISGLATAVALAAVDTVVDGVKGYTDTLPTIQATIEAAITDAHVSTDALLTSISADTSTDIPTLIAALHDPDTASIAAAVLDGVLTDLTDNSLNSGQTITLRKAIRAVFNRFFREVAQTASTQIVKNDAGSQVAVMTVSDDATTQTKGSAS